MLSRLETLLAQFEAPRTLGNSFTMPGLLLVTFAYNFFFTKRGLAYRHVLTSSPLVAVTVCDVLEASSAVRGHFTGRSFHLYV